LQKSEYWLEYSVQFTTMVLCASAIQALKSQMILQCFSSKDQMSEACNILQN